jgi:hypothetical protein
MRWREITPHVFGVESVTTVPTESETALLEAQSLVTHLQWTAETDKAALARILHDELGALMVSALMDLGSVQLQADIVDLLASVWSERKNLSRPRSI